MDEHNLLTSTQIPSDFPQTSYLGRIAPSDKNLLTHAVQEFRPRSKNYEDSWGYVIQATRYNGFRWYDPESGYIIFFGEKPLAESTLVIPTFFAPPHYLKSVIKNVQNSFNITKTVLKNVNLEAIQYFIQEGFRPYKENEMWDEMARFDDQTYPQQIVNLQNVIEAKGKKYHPLRKALNKRPSTSIREYVSKDRERVLELFALKDGNNPHNVEERTKGMYFVSHVMYTTADIDKFVIVNDTTDDIIGFTATSDISSHNTALVASIFRIGIRVESIWGIYQTLKIKYQQGFELVNLGGCETEGTHVFLNRNFRPSEELRKTHLVFEQ